MDIIISAATHRSGSTLLQRVFNVRKETLIWGEQDGLLTKFCQIHRNLKHYSENLIKQRLDYFDNGEDPNYWIACMNPEIKYVDKAVSDSLKVLLNSLYEQKRDDHDMIGFKEVRYGNDELTLFRKCYPDANIILLVRNPIDVWKSMVGAGLGQNINHFVKKWKKHALYYLQLSKNDSKSHLIKYEDMVNKDMTAIQTISNLGKIQTEEINTVLSKKIWSTPRQIAKSEEDFIIKECGMVMRKYDYL
ncbi:sulfotransferase [Virgibacillus byunsanensis]|uniref:Sulfotransferase n=1 Tax=Virgibacillus byunsanensis TaxID=570945 RepID=A0ABW3LPT8_9BACI